MAGPTQRQGWRRLARWGLVVLVMGIGFWGGGLVLLAQLARSHTRPWLDDYVARLEPGLKTYLELQARLKTEPFFTEIRSGGDCGPFFDANFSPTSSGCGGPRGPPGRLDLPSLPRRLLQRGTWLDRPVELDLAAFDFSWMQQLHGCATWRIAAASPDLSEWAKLRLLQGFDSGDPGGAARDVWQLAWLQYTTGRRSSAENAAALLRLIDQARTRWEASGSSARDWPTLSSAAIDDLDRVGRATDAFSSPLVPPAILRAAYSEDTAPINLCAALSALAEGATTLYVFAAADHPAYDDEVERLLQEAPLRCDLATARARFQARKSRSVEEARAWLARMQYQPSLAWLAATKLSPRETRDLAVGMELPAGLGALVRPGLASAAVGLGPLFWGFPPGNSIR